MPAPYWSLAEGGGARTINESILSGLDQLIASNVQVIWQTGKVYYEKCKKPGSRQRS
ncbi:MAG: hypothetical protein WDN75_20525 [Bacteroidota bacterium]